MAELLRLSVRAQLGAADPAATAPGVAVHVRGTVAQFYVPALQAPNTRLGCDPYTLWLAPDRALHVGGVPPAGFVSDMTDGLAIFDIVGPRAAEIVAMGCTLGADVLTAGRCAQTVVAGVHIVLYSYGDGLRLHVERPLAAFMLQWLQQAATALHEGSGTNR